jgi:hypothetical protein
LSQLPCPSTTFIILVQRSLTRTRPTQRLIVLEACLPTSTRRSRGVVPASTATQRASISPILVRHFALSSPSPHTILTPSSPTPVHWSPQLSTPFTQLAIIIIAAPLPNELPIERRFPGFIPSQSRWTLVHWIHQKSTSDSHPPDPPVTSTATKLNSPSPQHSSSTTNLSYIIKYRSRRSNHL